MRWNLSFVFLALPLVFGIPGSAQSTSLQGPSIGFVYDPVAKSIRPLVGYPGSAYLGRAVLGQLAQASLGPGATIALVVKDDALLAVPDLRQPGSMVMLQTGFAAWDQVAWSADSRTAAVYSAATQRLLIVRHLDRAPAADNPLDLTMLPGALTTLAIGNDAARLIAGVTDQTSGGLYLLGDGGRPILLLAPARNPTAAVFDSTGQNLFAVDRAARRIWQISNAATTLDASIFAEGRDKVPDPVGIALAQGGHLLAVANGQGGPQPFRQRHPPVEHPTVSLFDIPSRSILQTLDLDVAPATLSPLASDIFLLNTRTVPGGPLFILQAQPPAAVYFVPAQTTD